MDKTLVKLIKKKSNGAQIIKIRKETREITINSTETQRNIEDSDNGMTITWTTWKK